MQPTAGTRLAPNPDWQAEVIDFEAERMKRFRSDAAARRAAEVLADFHAGRVPFRAVLAALVAPYAAVRLDTPC